MLGYLSLDIISSSKLTVSLELRSWKTIRLSEQIMSADKHPSIFSRQMETIVHIIICISPKAKWKIAGSIAHGFQAGLPSQFVLVFSLWMT